MDFQFQGRQELWIASIPILLKTRVMDSLHTFQPSTTISMDKIYEAAICRYWTTKRMEIHEVNRLSTLSSVCLKAFSNFITVSGQIESKFHAAEGRDIRVWICGINKNLWDRERVTDICIVMFFG